jgi:hypothetical protein
MGPDTREEGEEGCVRGGGQCGGRGRYREGEVGVWREGYSAVIQDVYVVVTLSNNLGKNVRLFDACGHAALW